MKIKLTEQDLHKIVENVVRIIAEGNYDFMGEVICRLPYIVTLVFTKHCIERENERSLMEQRIISDASQVIKQIIQDFENREIKGGDYVKVINRETCLVSVLSPFVDKSGRRILRMIAVTAYVWKGRVNIDNTGKNYYIGEPSEEYLEAKKWNEENQDKVLAYMAWKRDTDIRKQRRTAETDYAYRSNSTLDPGVRMKLMNMTYDNRDRGIHKSMIQAIDPNELQDIKAQYRDVDKKPISTKGSANRDLRAWDLWKQRKENQEQ